MKLSIDFKYIGLLWIFTSIVGPFFGTFILFFYELYTGTYTDSYGNPFYNYLFFTMIGFIESIIPMILYLLVSKFINKLTNKKIQLNLLYFSGVIITILSIISFYPGLNEGYYFSLALFGASYVVALIIAFRIFRPFLIEN
jgi:hypothetical protein